MSRLIGRAAVPAGVGRPPLQPVWRPALQIVDGPMSKLIGRAAILAGVGRPPLQPVWRPALQIVAMGWTVWRRALQILEAAKTPPEGGVFA